MALTFGLGFHHVVPGLRTLDLALGKWERVRVNRDNLELIRTGRELHDKASVRDLVQS